MSKDKVGPNFVDCHSIDAADFHWSHVVVSLEARCVDQHIQLVVLAICGNNAVRNDFRDAIAHQSGFRILNRLKVPRRQYQTLAARHEVRCELLSQDRILDFTAKVAFATPLNEALHPLAACDRLIEEEFIQLAVAVPTYFGQHWPASHSLLVRTGLGPVGHRKYPVRGALKHGHLANQMGDCRDDLNRS